MKGGPTMFFTLHSIQIEMRAEKGQQSVGPFGGSWEDHAVNQTSLKNEGSLGLVGPTGGGGFEWALKDKRF